MKKLIVIVLAFSVLFSTGNASVFADLQIDSGQTRGQAGAVSKFFVGRNARQDTTISADRVVVWDSTSNDGVSVTTSTTSYDGLVAGVTIDSIPGITSDSTAAAITGATANWGRIRVYGRHANVSWDSGAEPETGTAGNLACTAGTRVAAHSVAGTATILFANSGITSDIDLSTRRIRDASRDSFGVTLEACSDQNKLIDIFVDRG